MALTPNQIKQMKADLQEVNKLYTKLGKTKIDINFSKDKLNLTDVKLLSEYLKEAKVAAIDLEDGFGGIEESIKNIVREWKPGFADPVKEATKSMGKLRGLAQKLSDDVNRITRLSEKQLETIEKQAKAEEARLNALIRELEAKKSLSGEEQTILNNLKKGEKVQDDILKKVALRREEEAKITELTGMTGKALKGASGILKKIGINIGSETFDKLSQGARDYAEELKNANKDLPKDLQLDEAQIQAKVMGDTLEKSAVAFKKEILLALDVAIFNTLKKGIKEFGEGRAGLSKTFGLGRDDANNIADGMFRAARAAGNSNVSMRDNIKSLQEFNSLIGGSIRLSEDQLTMQSLLSDELGLTSKQAGNFIKMSLASGKNAKDLTNELRGQIKILNIREGGLVNEQAVFAKIGDASALTKMNLKAQGISLADAAFQAQKMGMELGDMEGTKSSLLDFESSIQNEMKAELLMGRQLNLEDARRAALMNDEVGLMKAISREMGTAKEFGEMNYKAQEAFAQTLGKSREEVAKILETNELLTGEAKSLTQASEMYNEAIKDGKITDEERRAIGKDALIDQLSAQANADRFAKSMERLRDQLTPIITKFSDLLDKLLDGVEYISEFEFALTSIGKLMAGIAGIRIWARLKAGIGIITKALGGIKSLVKQVDKVSPGGSTKEISKQATKSGGGGVMGFLKGVGGNIMDKASSAYSGAKGLVGKGINFVKGKIPDLSKLTKFFSGSNLLKTLGKFGKRIPVIGAFLEGIFANSDIQSSIASGEPDGVINQMIGKRVISGIGSVIGSAGGAALGSFLGPIGTIAGGIGGDFLGRYVGGILADNMSSMTPQVGGFVRKNFYGGGKTEMATGGFATNGPVDAIVGEAGGEAVIPLTQFYAKIDELIFAVKQGQIIQMDGNKVGQSIALATSNLG